MLMKFCEFWGIIIKSLKTQFFHPKKKYGKNLGTIKISVSNGSSNITLQTSTTKTGIKIHQWNVIGNLSL